MPFTTYPTDKDLSEALKESGVLTLPSQARMQALIKAAANQFELRTGWLPFLGQVQSRSFDPPGVKVSQTAYYGGGDRKLVLDAGLVTLYSLQVNGTPLVQNKDFWLRPANTAPTQYIEFQISQYGLPLSITVSGLWGYSATLPEDAWLAIIRLAQIDLTGEYLQLSTGGLVKWSEGSVSEEYGSKPLEGVLQGYKTYVDKIIQTYRRIGVG